MVPRRAARQLPGPYKLQRLPMSYSKDVMARHSLLIVLALIAVSPGDLQLFDRLG